MSTSSSQCVFVSSSFYQSRDPFSLDLFCISASFISLYITQFMGFARVYYGDLRSSKYLRFASMEYRTVEVLAWTRGLFLLGLYTSFDVAIVSIVSGPRKTTQEPSLLLLLVLHGGCF